MLKPLYELNEHGQMQWHPHEFQLRAYRSLARFTFLPKGWRGGFSSFAPKLLELEMKRCGPGHANLAYFLIAPTLKVATKPGSIQPAVESIFCTHMNYATYNKNEHTFYTTKDGERALWDHEQKERTPITVCYAEDPDSFASATFLGGLADEVGQLKFRREAWNTLRSRMSTTVSLTAPNNVAVGKPRDMKMGRVFAGSTVYSLNWFVDFYEQWKVVLKVAKAEHLEQIADLMAQHDRARTEQSRQRILAEVQALKEDFASRAYYGLIHHEMNFIRFDSTANPAFSAEEMENFRRTLPDWFFDMRFRAIPRKPAGTIIEHFDPERDIIDNYEVPDSWLRGGGIDFGKRNFYGGTFFEHPETKEHILYSAYHRSDLTISGHGTKLSSLYPEVTDWTAGQISEQDQRDQLASGGLMSVAPPFKDLWTGINNLASGFKLGRVKIFRDLRPKGIPNAENYCDDIKEQLRSYSRPVDDNGKVDEDADPEEKEKFHWVDVFRYYSAKRFAGFGQGEIVASSRKTEGMQEAEVMARLGQTQTKGLPSDLQVLAGTPNSNRFAQERYGDVYDPMF